MYLNNQWFNKEEIKETNENGITNFLKSMGCSKSSSKREVYSSTGLPQETRKLSNKQSNLTLKELEKEETMNKVSRRKEKNKDQNRNK